VRQRSKDAEKRKTINIKNLTRKVVKPKRKKILQ